MLLLNIPQTALKRKLKMSQNKTIIIYIQQKKTQDNLKTDPKDDNDARLVSCI